MKKPLLLLLVIVGLSLTVHGQSGRNKGVKIETDKKTSTSQTEPGVNESRVNPEGETVEGDVIRTDTALVTVPVTVMDRSGRYVPLLKRENFRILENGVEQKIAYFAATDSPFTVILLIDTSGSTHFRLDDIQDAAINFVSKLKANDSVMVMSFDDRIDVLCKATNDRDEITRAIRRTRTGGGTRLYDAVDDILKKQLATIRGRKAVVLFTDGVDTTSRRASSSDTIRLAEESEAPIYSVNYDTSRANTVLGGGGGMRLPGGIIIGGGQGQGGSGTTRGDARRGADYLRALSDKTGGRSYNGDSRFGISQAFTWIAEELGRQYSLGYYPTIAAKDGERRQIKVRTTEADLVVKSRDSYVVAESRKDTKDSK